MEAIGKELCSAVDSMEIIASTTVKFTRGEKRNIFVIIWLMPLVMIEYIFVEVRKITTERKNKVFVKSYTTLSLVINWWINFNYPICHSQKLNEL